MQQRTIGTSGPSVSALGLGCMGMSFAYGGRDDEQSAQTLLRALDLGITHFDTADMYGFGHNEQLIGRVLGSRRDEFILATKFANRITEAGDRYVDSSAAWALEACDASLQRLGTDHIDLYYMHRRNADTPIEETVGAMASLVQAGKVRWLGLSEVNSQTLRKAHAVHPINAVQVEYSLFTRFPEEGLLDTCRELGIALVAYSPVGRGWLTGTFTSPEQFEKDDFRSTQPRFTGENFEHNAALADNVRKVAEEIGCTPAQAALAWLLAQGDDVLPIPGTKRITYLEENTASADIRLTPDQVERLSAAVPQEQVAGDRYLPGGMATVGL